MKRIQRLIAIFALTMVIACSAMAGDMPGPGAQQPPPSSITATEDTPIPEAEPTDSTSVIYPVTQLTLSLLQSLLLLF